MTRTISRASRILILMAAALILASGTLLANPPSEAQKERLKNLAMETRKKAMHERETLRDARIDLLRLYRNYDLDDRKTKIAIAKIKEAQMSLLSIHLESQMGIRGILNEDQFRGFQEKFRRLGPGHEFIGPFEDGPMDRLPDRKLLEELHVTPEQARKLRETLGPTEEKRRTFGLLRNYTKQTIELYSKYDLDKTAAKKLIENMHAAQSDLLDINFKNQRELRKILSESQFKAYVEKIDNRMENRPHPPKERRPKRTR